VPEPGAAPAPAPAPAPGPAPTPGPDGTVQLASIASNFDVNAELVPSWGTGQLPPASPDPVGAFRFICNASHESYDDPIVYPGQPGKAHLHQFFGNSLANANSTYESLRTSGQSTCNSPLNRSAYWVPAMMNGKGQVVRPDYVSIYYKRTPASDPKCDWTRDPQGTAKACIALPRGLRYVFDKTSADGQEVGYFNCDGPTAVPGHYPDIVTAAMNCPNGNKLGIVIASPPCWDGKNLDSPNHRSHMAYVQNTGLGYWACPQTHPYAIPQFTLGAWYTVDDDLDRSGTWDGSRPTWHLSSDNMPGMPVMKPGTTLHADWFGAWDDTILKTWHDNCINKMLNCTGGDLGNGMQMKMFAAFSWTASPRIVAPPPKP